MSYSGLSDQPVVKLSPVLGGASDEPIAPTPTTVLAWAVRATRSWT